MKAYKSVNGVVDTREGWEEAIKVVNEEDDLEVSFEEEVDTGRLVEITLNFSVYAYGRHLGDHIEWTREAEDDDGNLYQVSYLSPVGDIPSWNEGRTVTLIEEV